MNIQPVGAAIVPRLDDRVAQPAAAAQAGPAAPASVSGARPEAAAPAPSRDEVSAAVKKMNDAMLGSSQSLQFSIDEDSKDIVVKVIDQNTKEVVRQMPSKEALQIAKSIDKLQQQQQGLLIDQTA
jgi:flagellar protein FlaG